MGRQFLHIEQRQSVAGENLLYRQQREITEMLVIDGVELVALHQLPQVRKLHRDHAVRGEQSFQSGDEVVEVGHMREHIVAEHQVCLAMGAGNDFGGGAAQKADFRGNTFQCSSRRDIGGRLYTENRHAPGNKMLQKVAVVACNLDDLAGRPQPETLDRHFRVKARMLDPAA